MPIFVLRYFEQKSLLHALPGRLMTNRLTARSRWHCVPINRPPKASLVDVCGDTMVSTGVLAQWFAVGTYLPKRASYIKLTQNTTLSDNTLAKCCSSICRPMLRATPPPPPKAAKDTNGVMCKPHSDPGSAIFWAVTIKCI